MSAHPELFHYTKPEAFESVIKSQTLWCSHYRTMLDQDEVRLIRDLLPPAVAPRMDAIVEKDASGRGAQTSRDLVNSLYGATVDGKAEYSTLDPYLFSFSTHSEDTTFNREHGIKSQCENYGGPQGYCLVFDIRQLAGLLRLEGSKRYWAWLMLQRSVTMIGLLKTFCPSWLRAYARKFVQWKVLS